MSQKEIKVDDIKFLYVFTFAKHRGSPFDGKVIYEDGRAFLRVTPDTYAKMAAAIEDGEFAAAFRAAEDVKLHLQIARAVL